MLGLPDFGISEALNQALTGTKPTASTVNKGLYNAIYGVTGGTSTPSSASGPSGADLNTVNLSTGGGSSNNSNTGNANTSAAAKSTGSSNNGGASNALSAQNKKIQDMLKGEFSSTINNYSNQLKALPGQQQQAFGQIQNLAGSQKTSINDALNSALQTLQNNYGQVQTNQQQTLNDLSTNLHNALQSGLGALGSKGAGSSSAADEMNAWLAQQSSKQRADVQNQYGQQYTDINNTEVSTQSAAQQQLDAVDTWANTQMSTITSQYNDLQRQLEDAKSSASDQEKQAIANYQTQLYNKALDQANSIQQLQAQTKSYLSTQLGTQQGLAGQQTGAVQTAGTLAPGTIQSVPAAQLGSMNLKNNGDGTYTDISGIVWASTDGGQTYTAQGNTGGNNIGSVNTLSSIANQ